MEGIDVALAHLGHGGVLLTGPFEDLVVDVREVLNKGHLESSPDQEAPQDIPVDVTAGVAEMAEVVDRHSTAVNAYLVRLQRGERFGAAGKGVGKPQGHSCWEAAAEATPSIAGDSFVYY